MVVVVVDFKLHAEHFDAFKERMKAQARDSLEKEEDCLVFDISLDPALSDYVLLYEIYKSPEAFQAHLASDHFKSFDADISSWVVSREIRQLERLEHS